MKKILVLSSFPAPYRVAVFNELKKLYDMDIFFLLNKDDNRNEKYFEDKKKNGFYLYTDLEDRAYFRKCVSNIKSYDIVMAYDWYLPEALKVEMKCIVSGVPYVINCDGAFLKRPSSIKDKLKDTMKGFIIRHARACLAGGTSASDYFKFYGAKAENIYIHKFSSLHESDIVDTMLSDQQKEVFKRELNLSTKKLVLSVGQFIYRKGYDVLLKAWKELDDKYQLVIIGGGNLHDEYVDIIKQNRYENVSLIGFVEPPKVAKYYQAADLFVLPTREDVWGLVINEAMAYGLPVISTDRCQAAVELVASDCIVSVDDPESLNMKMSLLMNDGELRTAIGEKHLHKIRDYTIEKIVESHKNLLNRLLDI